MTNRSTDSSNHRGLRSSKSARSVLRQAKARQTDLQPWRSVIIKGCLGLYLVAILGCGNGTGNQQNQTDQTTPPAKTNGLVKDIPPVAAISTPQESHATSRETTPGSPESLLIEITKLVAAVDGGVTRPDVKTEANGPETGSTVLGNAEWNTEDQRRLEQIIELSTQVIAATHERPDLEQHFNNAVHYLSDARLELASAGDEVQAALLIEDADSLFQREAGSFAAAEAGFKVVELAHRMAESFGASDADWPREYANQSVQYSKRFPEQEGRAAMSLFTAGYLCDRSGQLGEALSCFALLKEKYTDSVFAEKSAGFLRRLTLPGEMLELSGPTIDGGFVEIEQYRDQIVLVVFWKSSSAAFARQLPVVQQLQSQFSKSGLAILGVNLDADESAVDRFLTKHQINWPQVFSADPNRRGGRNPVARFYSVQKVPTYWLIDRSGVVLSAPIHIEELRARVEKLIKNPQ